MPVLIFECGMATVSWYAELALRRRVSMSAIGSVMVMASSGLSRRGIPGTAADLRRRRVGYQELLVMPGSSPACAISRKQIRHRPNLR